MPAIQQFREIKDYTKTTRLPASRFPDFMISNWTEALFNGCAHDLPYQNHYFEIVFELNPTCEITIGQYVFPAAISRLFFISPHRLQSCQGQPSNEPGNGFTILFKPEFIHMSSSRSAFPHDFPFFNHLNSPGIVLNKQDTDSIATLFSQIHLEYDNHTVYTREILKNYLNILLLKGRNLYQPQTTAATGFNREQEIYNAFMLLVQEYFMKSDAVQQYADKLHINAKYLTQIAKKISGQTALQVIHQARLHHAKSLLRQTNLTISQIADELHFDNQEYFSVFFRRLTGNSPSQFRNFQSIS
ncbi:helix-turn-helix transcriptional regulator [Longitalea luteola]|uniref:helix-turn-helix transcriptional regulator n=1 Tax=Longitalea luteola TaxID=2812563 RepID=UPI001A97D0E2|nr:helix-turn-helix transcriptional regulator [Longitalea luteola]